MKVALFLLQAILLSAPIGTSAYAQADDSGTDRPDPFGHSLNSKYSKRKKLEAKRFAPAAAEEDVVRVETRLVVDDVLVTKKDGVAVRGLTKDDFLLYENDVQQDLALFSLGNDRGAIGRSVVLIIDYSGSERPYIENSIDAAKILIDGLNPHDRMAIVTDDVEVLSNFTTDRSQLKAQLEMLKQRSLAGQFGKSLQFSALMAAINELFGDTSLRPIVIFQTDGDEFPSLKRFVPPRGDIVGSTKFTFDELVEAAERIRATVYTIIPNSTYIGISRDEEMAKAEVELQSAYAAITGNDASKRRAADPKIRKQVVLDWAGARKRDETAIRQLAERTGGWSANLKTPEQAAEVYSQILLEFGKRYLIGYYPSNQEQQGERRKISIRIRNHPEYTVWGKKEYIVPK